MKRTACNKYFLMACVLSAATLAACNESSDWTECQKDDVICKDGHKLACSKNDNGVYVYVQVEDTDGKCTVKEDEKPECTAGSYRCEKNTLYSCVNNVWKESKACGKLFCNSQSGQCDNGPDVVINCDKTDNKCENGILTVCNEETGKTENSICPSYACDGSVCKSLCSDDETKCEANDENGYTLSKCVDGEWVADNQVCEFCSEDGKSCVEKTCSYELNGEAVTMHDGDSLCDNDKIVRCDFPNVVEDPCKVGLCDDSGDELTCTPRSCAVSDVMTLEHGSSACVDTKRVTCEDGTLAEHACDSFEVCANGETKCRPGKDCMDGAVKHLDSQCDADFNVAQCQDGTMVVAKECNAAAEEESERTFCSSRLECEKAGADDCAAVEDGHPLIANGDFWCDDNVLYQCINTQVDFSKVCSDDTPVCDTNACRAYKNCEDGGEEIAHGQGVCFEDPVATGLCIDGRLTRDEGNGCLAHQICVIDEEHNQASCQCDEDNNWTNGEGGCVCASGWGGDNCDCNLSTSYVNESGECLTKCSANVCTNTDTGSTFVECGANGVPLAAVEQNVSCASATTVGECWNEALDCNGLQPVVCMNGLWSSKGDACTFVCKDGSCADTNLCSDDSQCTPSGDHKVGKCEIIPGQAYGTCISVCDAANHWVGTDTCTCDEANKYILSGDSCSLVECVTTEHCTSRLPSNATEWSCNTTQYQCEIAGCDKGFSVSDDKLSCVCAAGSIVVNNECVTKKTCNTGEVLDETTNTCACDTAHGYIVFEEACVAKAVCRTGEVYNDASNACDCDTDNNYIAYGGACVPKATCTTDDFYEASTNTCVPKATCGDHEVYDEATNTCACDTDNLWTGTAGSCTCSGFLNASGGCDEITICEEGMFYNAATNECDEIATCGEHEVYNFYTNVCLKAGDIITFGHYEQDDDTTNGSEPIRWRILDVKNGKVLIVSEKILDIQPYHSSYSSVTWEQSSIRNWLNASSFIDAAFSMKEQAQIAPSVVNNNPLSGYVTAPSELTLDKLFLLSLDEVKTYLGSDLKAEATHYAYNKGKSSNTIFDCTESGEGLEKETHCFGHWWLRTSGSTDLPSIINGGGYDSIAYASGNGSIRPALWMIIDPGALECGTGEIFDSASRTCACDTDNLWTGTTGSCTCNGVVNASGLCIPSCTTQEVYNLNTKQCVSKATCTPDKFYNATTNECDEKVTCNLVEEVYVADNNTCECDYHRGYYGTPGSCMFVSH